MSASFAVVGRVNEGKSSIISTLIGDDSIKVSPIPGTTLVSQSYFWRLDEQTKFEIIDTPGFQNPEQVLSWLEEDKEISAINRPERVRDFVATFNGTGKFVDECRLLLPILNGASILYIADISHPFRPSFEAEFEILRWTGAPRLALLNKQGEFEKEWRAALSQFFNFTISFDAFVPQWEQKFRLIDALALIRPELKSVAENAKLNLKQQRSQKDNRIANAVALYISSLFDFSISFSESEFKNRQHSQLIEEYKEKLRLKETQLRKTIMQMEDYSELQIKDNLDQIPIADLDLFSKEAWKFLGLTKSQLIKRGIIGGATIGGTVDVSSGFASHGIGTLVGAVLGGVGAISAPQALKTSNFPIELAGKTLQVGPLKDDKFIWLALDRTLIFLKQLKNRTHAMRDQMELNAESSELRSLSESERSEWHQGILKAKKGEIESLSQTIRAWLQEN